MKHQELSIWGESKFGHKGKQILAGHMFVIKRNCVCVRLATVCSHSLLRFYRINSFSFVLNSD